MAATVDGFQLSPTSTWSSAARATCSARPSRAAAAACSCCACCADEDLIASAREEATALVADDPQLTAHPAVKDAIDDFLGDRRAEFLDKA